MTLREIAGYYAKTVQIRPWIGGIWLVLLFLGCGSAKVEIKPPEIRYGEDTCAMCNMIISEERFAAAMVLKDGTALKFDDIGELAAYQKRYKPEVAQYYVHDYQSKVWISADSATYVQTGKIHTPMGFNLVAFSTADKAKAFAAEQDGKVLDFQAVLQGSADMKSH